MLAVVANYAGNARRMEYADPELVGSVEWEESINPGKRERSEDQLVQMFLFCLLFLTLHRFLMMLPHKM